MISITLLWMRWPCRITRGSRLMLNSLGDAADEPQFVVKLRIGVTPSAAVRSFPIKIREAAQVDRDSSVLRSL